MDSWRTHYNHPERLKPESSNLKRQRSDEMRYVFCVFSNTENALGR